MLSSQQPALPPACLALPGPPTLAATFPGIDLHQLSEISRLSPCAARPQPHSVLSRTCSSVPVRGVGETEGHFKGAQSWETEGHFKGAQSCKRSMHLGNALCCDDSVPSVGSCAQDVSLGSFRNLPPRPLLTVPWATFPMGLSFLAQKRRGHVCRPGLELYGISSDFTIFILTYTYMHYLLPLLLIICLLIIR